MNGKRPPEQVHIFFSSWRNNKTRSNRNFFRKLFFHGKSHLTFNFNYYFDISNLTRINLSLCTISCPLLNFERRIFNTERAGIEECMTQPIKEFHQPSTNSSCPVKQTIFLNVKALQVSSGTFRTVDDPLSNSSDTFFSP